MCAFLHRLTGLDASQFDEVLYPPVEEVAGSRLGAVVHS
jgi:hypothetical protein